MKDVAKAALDHFKDKGLFVLKKQNDGTTVVITTKIGKEQYENTPKEWSRRDAGTGFTP